MSDAQFATFTLADHVFGVEVESVQEVIRYQPMSFNATFLQGVPQ